VPCSFFSALILVDFNIYSILLFEKLGLMWETVTIKINLGKRSGCQRKRQENVREFGDTTFG